MSEKVSKRMKDGEVEVEMCEKVKKTTKDELQRQKCVGK